MIISKKARSFLAKSTSIFGISFVGLSASLIIPVSLVLTACGGSDSTNVNSHRAQQTTHRVEVITVERKPVNLTQVVSGTLEAVTKIRLYNEESSRITQLPYHEGDSVKKGSLLVQLDSELLKADVAKAKAIKQQKKVNFERLKKLLPNKISTEEEVANARTELDLAIAEEKHQLIRLKRTRIKAPINGLITKRFFEPGDLLKAHSHIHTIIDPSSLLLVTSIAERWIPLIDKDQKITVRIDALGDKKFDAKIVRIHPTINSRTHKGTIEIRLDPAPKNAKVGQFARATIYLQSNERLIVPAHTIHFEPEGAFVYLIVEGEDDTTIVKKVSLEQGQQFGPLTEVLTGLNKQDKIVSRGYLGLREGKVVEVIDTATSSSKNPVKDTIDEKMADTLPADTSTKIKH